MTKRVSISLALVAALLLTAAASPAAESKRKSCVKRGDKVEKRYSSGLVFSRSYRGKVEFDGGGVRRYACSYAYGKRVSIGLEGVQIEGEMWVRALATNRRYVAYVNGGAGNAGGGSDTSVAVRDLKTGRIHSQGSPGFDPAWYGVVKLIMKSNGDIAYITRVSGTRPLTFQVWSRTVDGQQLLATADNIDLTYLAYGPSGEVLWRIAN